MYPKYILTFSANGFNIILKFVWNDNLQSNDTKATYIPNFFGKLKN